MLVRTADYAMTGHSFFANFACLAKRLEHNNFLIRTRFSTKRVALGSFFQDGHGHLGFEPL